MPVVQVDTPNLANDLLAIDAILVDIENNAPTTFDSIINTNFKLKPTQDCDTLVLKDFTDYQELEAVDLDMLTITVALVFKTNCGEDQDCPAFPISPNATTIFEKLDKDGIYCAKVQLDYIRDEMGTPVPYSKIIDVCFKKDCCTSLYAELACLIWSKMSHIACTIAKHYKIGRKVFKLNDSYLKLSNLYWLYNHSVDACKEYDQVYCLYNKIK